MTHHRKKFDWGKVFRMAVDVLGYDHGYAAYRADQAERRWKNRRGKRTTDSATDNGKGE